jgi:GntR family transcriptional repressor for pyruvate dehydrogenase complex
LVEDAVETIRQRIDGGELETGDRLPPERVLVEELSVSRTVLREALSSLAALGLIEARGTRGRFVSARGSSEGSRAVISGWLHDNAREILDIDEIRSVLESHAIRAITEWDSVDAARRAGAVLRAQRDAVRRHDAIEASRLDAEFHLVLSSYTKNKALQALLSDLVATSGPETLAIYSLPDASERSLLQHQEIVDALGQADIKRVSDVARMHLIDAAQRYLSSFDEPAPSVPR